MMTSIRNVAIFGASGNFGKPITAAVQRAGFGPTIITRSESTSTFPSGIPVIRATYTLEELTKALEGQDAAVCVVGPAGIGSQVTMIDAAQAAGVKRFIIDDFGWGPNPGGLPDFEAIQAQRRVVWDHAKALSGANPAFTYSGIATGNPIDWALKRFPTMGFDIEKFSAVIYDSGTEGFTGTSLEGIGQAVVGVLQHPVETANRPVKARSILTCQNDLLEAFENATGQAWDVQRSSTKALIERGRNKRQSGANGWVLDLVVAQLFDEGQGRCVVAPSREESDADLLGVIEETPQQVVAKALKTDG